ncbi:MAG: fibronectin type III domain-containing protein [Clostridia bacterium]|nr:fibronectin type III domain-containing protein [Clostridia bacterium]
MVDGSKKRKGISLIILIITIVVMLILATTVIVFVMRKNPIQSAKDANLKNEMQTMLDEQNERYKDLLFQKAGDDSKINDGDFQGIVSDEYKEQGFDATKDGVLYKGEDDHVKDIAIEMGLIVTDKNIVPIIEGILYASTTCTIKIDVTSQDTLSQIEDYNYYISKDGNNWSKYAEAETPYVIGRLTDNTDYKVKVELVDINGNRVESEPATVRTKELLRGSLVAKLNSSTGAKYEFNTWTKEDIWVNAIQSATGSTSYSATGANIVAAGTTTPTTLKKQGETKIHLITTDGTNNKTADYVIKIDKDAPTGTITTTANTNSIYTKINNPTDNLSGIAKYEYYLDGELKNTSQSPEFTYQNLTQGSNHEVKVVVTDVAKNSTIFTKGQQLPIVPDAEDVITYTLNPDKWTNQDVTLTVKYPRFDGLFAQFSDSKDASGNKIWSNVSSIGQAIDYKTTIRTNKTVYVRYTDITNQVGKEMPIVINIIDKLAPDNITLSSSTKENVQSVSVIVSVQDTPATEDYGMSGIEEIKYLWSTKPDKLASGDALWNSSVNIANDGTVTRGGTNEVIYLHVRTKDKAGNYTTAVSGRYLIDNQAPTVIFNPNGNSTYAKSQSTVVTVNDNFSIDGTYVRYSWTQSTTAPAESSFPTSNTFTSGQTITKNNDSGSNWYLWVLAKDLTGNTTIIRSNAFYLDNTNPVISSFNKTSHTINTVQYTAQASDAHSGIKTYQFYIGGTLKSTVTTTAGSASYKFTGLTPLTNYTFKVRVTDNAGNFSESSSTFTINNVVEAKNISATGYDVYVYTNTNPYIVYVQTWADLNGNDDKILEAVRTGSNGVYKYRVNVSAHKYKSGVYNSLVYLKPNENAANTYIGKVTPEVPADETPPDAPTITLKYNNSSGSQYPRGYWTAENVYVKATSSDNVGIKKFQYMVVAIDGKEVTDPKWSDTPPSAWNPSKNGNTIETVISSGINSSYFVRAVDYNDNKSLSSIQFTIKIDKTPPKAFNIAYENVGKTAFTITASTSDPETGIKEYQYEIIGVKSAKTANNSYQFTGLTPGTNYKVKVTAYNKVGLSTGSNSNLSITTSSDVCPSNVHVFGAFMGDPSTAKYGDLPNYVMRNYHYDGGCEWFDCKHEHHVIYTSRVGPYRACVICGRTAYELKKDFDQAVGEANLWCPGEINLCW